jgi:putative FmdB family regulatory protein
MPFYEYQCDLCGHHLEALQKISEAPLRKCPDCGKSRLRRLISPPVFRLKGSGWYETDFKSDKEGKRNLAGHAEKDEAKTVTAEAKPDTKADVKAETKPDAKPEPRSEPKPEGTAKRTSVAISKAKRTPRPVHKKRPGSQKRRG